jgi:transposase
VATLAVTRRLDLTNEQWARLEPPLPVPTRSGRPSAWAKRQLIDGIRWRVRVGAPWRDVPDCYGSWRAVYALFGGAGYALRSLIAISRGEDGRRPAGDAPHYLRSRGSDRRPPRGVK